ncbi:MAG: hypothetical protein INR62_03825 [Rhodospirillales bacterium]|nr:hypothetical protein [Acetobacter sp.]
MPARDALVAFFDAEEPPHFLSGISPGSGSAAFHPAARELAAAPGA